jgi:hypothetical protein
MGQSCPRQVLTIGRAPPGQPLTPVDLAPERLFAGATAAHVTDLSHRNRDKTDMIMTKIREEWRCLTR